MILLWTAVSALALAWMAGDGVLGLIVAPQLFHLAGSTAGVGTPFAGLVFQDVLMHWVTVAGLGCVIPISVLLAAAGGRLLKRRGWRAALLPIIPALLVVGMHSATATMVAAARDRAIALREHPDPVLMERFKTEDHALYRAVFGAEMLLALGLAAFAAVIASRGGGDREGTWRGGLPTTPSRTPPLA